MSYKLIITSLLALCAATFRCGAQTATGEEIIRPVNSSWMLDAGSAHVADTYLSPLKYTGWNVSFEYERLQAMKFSPEAWRQQLQVGVEFEASTRMQDTSVSFGYQLDLPKANLLFKGSVDSNWIVGATLEKKLPPLPLTLALGAFLNHRKNKFQCGFGLTIG